MIVSLDSEKQLEKNKHHFRIKTSRKLGIKEKFLNMIKSIYENLTANNIFNGKRLKMFI